MSPNPNSDQHNNHDNSKCFISLTLEIFTTRNLTTNGASRQRCQRVSKLERERAKYNKSMIESYNIVLLVWCKMSWIILVILNLYYFAPSVFVDGAFEQGQESEYRKYWQQFMLLHPQYSLSCSLSKLQWSSFSCQVRSNNGRFLFSGGWSPWCESQ